jgi:hypothetical protein
MKDVFETYLHQLRQDRGEKTELSDRPALDSLLKAAAKAADPTIRVIHEAKKVRGKGGPDFKVMKVAMILGYVEDKTIGENLDQVLRSDQIARYKQLSNNFLAHRLSAIHLGQGRQGQWSRAHRLPGRSRRQAEEAARGARQGSLHSAARLLLDRAGRHSRV